MNILQNYTGISIGARNLVRWFPGGFSLGFTILLDHPLNELDLYTIFHIEVEGKGSLKLIQQSNKLIYQITNLKSGQKKSAVLGEVPIWKWFFFYIIHDKGFFKKSTLTYGRDNLDYEQTYMDYPKISEKLFLKKFEVAPDFSGQLGNFFFFSQSVKVELLKKFNLRFPLGVQYKSDFHKAIDIFKQGSKNLLFFLSPFCKSTFLFLPSSHC